MSNLKYISSITSLRGIACLLVLFFHLFCLSGGYYQNDTLLTTCSYGKYGIHMFFVISGFVITHSFINCNYSIKNFLTFLKKRIIRIEPAYLITLVFGIIYIMARNLIIEKTYIFHGLNIYEILAHLGYVVPFLKFHWINIVFWTLAIEFQFYILLAILFPIISKYKFVLLVLALPSLLDLDAYKSIFSFISIFNFGILLAYYYNKEVAFKEFFIYILVSTIFILYVNGIVVFFFTLPVFLTIILSLKINNRILNFVGKISYSLYLIHTLTVFSIINIAHRFPKEIAYKIGFALLALSLSVFISYLMYILVEKPTMKLSKRIAYND